MDYKKLMKETKGKNVKVELKKSEKGVGLYASKVINKGEIIAITLGVFLFGLTVYAMSLSIKANTLNLKK